MNVFLTHHGVGRAGNSHNVHPAVVIEVQERDAGPHGLGQESLGGEGVIVNPSEAAGRCRDFFEQRSADRRTNRQQPESGKKRPAAQFGSHVESKSTSLTKQFAGYLRALESG